ncbi:N-acetylmuramoyl-L-alanine amidase, partial [Acinetobacter baumannii]
EDRNLGIGDRAKMARDHRAAAFVSIHFNAAPPDSPPAQGTETWIGNGHTALSRRLADQVQREILAVTGHRNRGVKVGAVSGVI